MRRVLFVLCLITSIIAVPAIGQPAATPASATWKAQVEKMMPLLGHRNWILIVDSAYPLQNSSGIETIETNAEQLDVLKYVLKSISASRHVRPLFTMDAELPFVPDTVVPTVTAYRGEVASLLHGYSIDSQPHAAMLSQIDETGKQYRVLVLKTTMTIPYSSVFIRLDCKYWGAEDEKRLRAKMAAAGAVPKLDQ
jgi:hypothetical protein